MSFFFALLTARCPRPVGILCVLMYSFSLVLFNLLRVVESEFDDVLSGDCGGDDAGDHQVCCLGDIDGDHMVDGKDLAYVLGAWNTSGPQADLDQSNLDDGADLVLVLG